MTKTTRIVVLLTALTVGVAPEVKAQIQPAPLTRGFINVNVGAQPQRRDFSTTSSFDIYEETATITAVGRVGNGVIFDISTGYRIWDKLNVAVGFSSFGDTDQSTVISSIPHPLFFNLPLVSETTVPDMKHSERAFYVQAVYPMPITDKIDLAFGIGPTFINVKQDLATGGTVAAGTQNVTPIVETQSKTAVGVNVSFDGTYLFRRRFGAGLMIRYSGASVDLPAIPGLDVGGFQAGIGLRVRY